MAEKQESGSKLDALLERIPVLDGGGRRRLTAGAITLLTVLVAFSNIGPSIKEAIAAKDTSLSLLLAVGALLIYATGVLVELIGEIFLARAVANAVWSYVEAANHTKQWHRVLRLTLAPFYVTVWGSIRALAYFSQGLFGRSYWQMRLRRRLSANARFAYDRLPYPIRIALRHSLGAKAEFGRMALIERLASPRKRRWARSLMERPRDVLTLVSALVISLLILLIWSPIRQDLSSATARDLEAIRSELENIEKPMDAASADIEDYVDNAVQAAKAKSDARPLELSLELLKGSAESFDTVLTAVKGNIPDRPKFLEKGRCRTFWAPLPGHWVGVQI